MFTLLDVTLLAGGQNWLAWIVLGALAGYITKRVMGGKEGFITETVLGIVGALLAAFVASLLFSANLTFFPSLLVAILGAVVVVYAWRTVNHSLGRTTRV